VVETAKVPHPAGAWCCFKCELDAARRPNVVVGVVIGEQSQRIILYEHTWRGAPDDLYHLLSFFAFLILSNLQ
jgi:hypothetical protein